MTPAVRLIQNAFAAYRALFAQIAVLIVVLYLPLYLLSWISGVPQRMTASVPAVQEQGQAGEEPASALPQLPFDRSPQNFARVAALSLLGLMVSLLELAAASWLVQNYLRGLTLGWREALQYAISRFWPMAVTGVMTSVIVFGAAILLIIPAVIFGIYFSQAAYAAALRDLSGWAAIDYSRQLVKGNWWRVFGILLLFSLITVAAGLLVNFALTMLRPFLYPLGLHLLLPFLAQQLLNMFPVVGLTLLFFDLENARNTGPAGF